LCLNIIVCALADRGGKIGSVKIGGNAFPDLAQKEMKLPVKEANRLLGMKFTPEQVASMLVRLGHDADAKAGKVKVPVFRGDVIHAVDLVEDVAIAHGFNEFEPTLPGFFTPGRLLRKEERALHSAMTGLGFLEVMTWSLTSRKALEAAGYSHEKVLELANPLTDDFTVMRPALVPNALSVLATSKSERMPQKIYELGIVNSHGKEERRLCAAITHSRASFSEMKSGLQALAAESGLTLSLSGLDHPAFIKGRCAEVSLGGRKAGIIGEITPSVLARFSLEQPVAAFEIILS
jgi:phenylalanyl-tRNA synthetase beta chain